MADKLKRKRVYYPREAYRLLRRVADGSYETDRFCVWDVQGKGWFWYDLQVDAQYGPRSRKQACVFEIVGTLAGKPAPIVVPSQDQPESLRAKRADLLKPPPRPRREGPIEPGNFDAPAEPAPAGGWPTPKVPVLVDVSVVEVGGNRVAVGLYDDGEYRFLR